MQWTEIAVPTSTTVGLTKAYTHSVIVIQVVVKPGLTYETRRSQSGANQAKIPDTYPAFNLIQGGKLVDVTDIEVD